MATVTVQPPDKPPIFPDTPSPRVVVTDIQIPFGSLFALMLKISIAMIPLALLWFFLSAVIAGLLGGVAKSL